MSAQQKASKAYHLLRALYAKRAPAAVLRRAERLVHITSCRAFAANGSKA